MKCRQFIFGLLLGICISGAVRAQQRKTYRHMLRGYEDNDNINSPGRRTDRGYTNGTRFDYFFIKDKPSHFFLNRLIPKAGDSSINTYGWGLMQVIISPKNILKKIPDRNDYPYAGALFATHSLFSSNPIKKYNWQTKWMMGVMGPPSLAREAQEYAHRLVGYIQPGGWDYQLKTDPLLNVSVAAEKELVHINNVVEFIGGSQASAGTALNGAAVYSLIRFGKMEPYFNGYLSQFTARKGSKPRHQIYGIIRPAVEWMLTNALIDGGIFNGHKEPIPEPSTTSDEPEMKARVRNRIAVKVEYGVVASFGSVCISFTQTTATPMVKGTGKQEIGNISLFFAW
ncbi:lipid A deacylase LpxR family protein [Niastella caeni]|uniref:Lipid A deacylase LpxR family protein n=1 Tax=Niastella caeni TaxID=2569763 RepID=A0A4S8HZK0_9BACT|nr:lipid A deacylase LpxR family protein [Niastella caeni]THU41120.1 lipid A deacylase LpxR family protein [Niastella caeni]